MPKASTQDGLDEGILEASLTTFPTRERSRGKPVPLLRFVPSKKSSWNGPRRHQHPQPVTIHMSGPLPCLLFPLLPFFQLTSASSCLPSPCPTHLLATLPSHPAAGPQLGRKRAPNSRLLPPPRFHFLLLLPAIFPCPLPTPHTKATHKHTHTHTRTRTLPRPKPGLTLSCLWTSACRQGRVRGMQRGGGA